VFTRNSLRCPLPSVHPLAFLPPRFSFLISSFSIRRRLQWETNIFVAVKDSREFIFCHFCCYLNQSLLPQPPSASRLPLNLLSLSLKLVETHMRRWFTGGTSKTNVNTMPPKKKPEPAAPAPAAAVPAKVPTPPLATSPATNPAAAVAAAKPLVVLDDPIYTTTASAAAAGSPEEKTFLTKQAVLHFAPEPRMMHPKRLVAAKTFLKSPRKRFVETTIPSDKVNNTTSTTPKTNTTTKRKHTETPGSSSDNKKKKKEGTPAYYSGPPTENIGVDWTGWTKKSYERMGGATKGRPDHYWFTPVKQYKLRSHAEVRRFLSAMFELADEEKAWIRLKGKH
jgi:hypothetical protein